MKPKKEYSIKFKIFKIKIKRMLIKLKKKHAVNMVNKLAELENQNEDLPVEQNIEKIEVENKEINEINNEKNIQAVESINESQDLESNEIEEINIEKNELEKYDQELIDEKVRKTEYILEKYKNIVENIKKKGNFTETVKNKYNSSKSESLDKIQKNKEDLKDNNIKITESEFITKFKIIAKFLKEKLVNGLEFVSSKLEPDFSNLKKKISFVIISLVVLSVIGVSTFYIQKFVNSSHEITKRYISEIEKKNITIDANNIIQIQKDDMNNDGIKDYICLTGNYNGVNSNDKIKAYDSFGISIIDGSTNEVKEYKTDKTLCSDYKFYIKENDNKKYIFVNSESSCSVALVTFIDNNIQDVLQDSFAGVPSGYAITYNKNEQNNTLDVTVNNNGISYLTTENKSFSIDLSNKSIDISKYRKTYLKEKFNYFDFYDMNNDGKLDIIGVQNILYLTDTDSTLSKTYGKVLVIFSIEDNKLLFKDVLIQN